MARVTCKIVGGNSRDLSASTIEDVKKQLGVSQYQAVLNGSPANDYVSLRDDDFVTLSPAVKAG